MDRMHGLATLADEAITVGHLIRGQELTTLASDLPAAEAVEALDADGYSWAPVTNVPVAHYVSRETLAAADSSATVSECADAIPAELRLAVDTPLSEALDHLRRHEQAFVTYDAHVVGIATRADVQMPAVSLLTMGFITSLEASLDILIERYTANRWHGLLAPSRLAKAEEIYEDRRRVDSDISLIRCLTLDHRLEVVEKLGPLRERLGFSSRRQFEKWERPLKKARDVLAHGGDLLSPFDAPIEALDFVKDIRATAQQAWELVLDDPELLGLQLRSQIDIEVEDSWRPLTGPDADPLPGEPVHVLTASNPGSRIRSAADNERATARLHRELEKEEATIHRARGHAESWSEDSLAVVGLSRARAIEFARTFGQDSIFELSEHEMRVIRCADGVSEMRDRRVSGDPADPGKPETAHAQMLTDAQLQDLWRRLWEEGEEADDGSDRRRHAGGVKWLLQEYGVRVTEGAGPHRPVRADALARLEAWGAIERIGGGRDTRTRAMWVNAPT